MKPLQILLAVMLLGACSQAPEPSADNTLPQLDLEQFRGRWVVVNYWAQWCKPCREEIPELNALDASYAQVAVLGVNFDRATGSELTQQAARFGIAFPTLLEDPAPRLGVNTPSALPTTLVLNPDGELVQTLVGPQNLSSLAAATGQVALPEVGPTTEDLIGEVPGTLGRD